MTQGCVIAGDAPPYFFLYNINILFFRLLMIYREQPGRAVSGEAAPGEQAPTGADWPGFYLSASFRLWLTVGGCGTHRQEPRGNGDDQARRGKGYPQRRYVTAFVGPVALSGFAGEWVSPSPIRCPAHAPVPASCGPRVPAWPLSRVGGTVPPGAGRSG